MLFFGWMTFSGYFQEKVTIKSDCSYNYSIHFDELYRMKWSSFQTTHFLRSQLLFSSVYVKNRKYFWVTLTMYLCILCFSFIWPSVHIPYLMLWTTSLQSDIVNLMRNTLTSLNQPSQIRRTYAYVTDPRTSNHRTRSVWIGLLVSSNHSQNTFSLNWTIGE